MTAAAFHVTRGHQLTSILERGRGGWGGQAVVLRVDVTGLELIPDPHPGFGDDRDRHAYAYAGNVSPDRLSLVEEH